MGLRSDGAVVAVGYKKDKRCDVSNWRDIVAICAGDDHTIGLRSDGTVVAAGSNKDGVFSGFKRKQIEVRLAEIEKELEKL